MTQRDHAPESACLPSAEAETNTHKNGGYRWNQAEDRKIDITGLPLGYIYDDERKLILRFKGLGTEPICGPLRVAMKVRNVKGTASAHVIEFYSSEGDRRHTVITATLLQAAPVAVAAQLAELGLTIHCTPSQLVHLLRQWTPDRHGWLADQPGWITVEDQLAYVTHRGKIHMHGREAAPPIIALGGEKNPDQAGSAKGWFDGPARLARGNPLVMFAISTALAGPLLEPLGQEGGGVGFYGGTSCGKSTALAAAVSVYGSPRRMMSYNATPAALEAAASNAKDSLLAIDEIPTRLASVARALTSDLYMLANGTGRKRSDRDIAHLEPSAWRTMLITTAEASLPEIFAQSGMEIPNGLTTRLADIPAESWAYRGFDHLHEYDRPAAFADALKRGAHSHYGHAAPRFLEALTRSLATNELGALEHAYAVLLADLLKPFEDVKAGPDDGPEQRVMRRFAVAALAGQLACHWKIVPWSKRETQAAIKEVAGLWLEQRRQKTQVDRISVPQQVQAYVNAHPELFADVGDGEEFLVGRHSGWHDAERLAIGSEAFAAIVHPTLPRVAARQLAKLGILIAGSEARSLQQRRSPTIDPSRGREYHVSMAALERHVRAAI